MLIISMIAFFMSDLVPQDPVITLLQSRGVDQSSQNISVDTALYNKVYHELNRDKPDFYFSIVPHNYPNTFNSIPNSRERTAAEKAVTQKFFLPKLYWHGSDNRYQKWISSFLQGNFGESINSGQRISQIVGKALLWTITISLIDLLLSFSLGISIGIFLAKNPTGRPQKILYQFLYFFYSMPKFWIATLLVVYFTTNDYGNWTNIFPSVGIDLYPGKSTFYTIIHNLDKLILPVLCLILFSVTTIARLLQQGISNEMKEPYITTALSKGLTQNAALKKHALPNALTPLITILAGAIPASLAGSVVIEVIFNIPGIGRLMFDSIATADWNIVYCILMLTSLVTALSFLIADLIYAFLNPRIRLAV